MGVLLRLRNIMRVLLKVNPAILRPWACSLKFIMRREPVVVI
jgi:hypothetical protein